MRSPLLFLALVLSAISTPAFADPHERVTFDPAQFATQKARIEEGLSSDQYKELARADRVAVHEALARIEQRLAGKLAMDELSEADRVAIFNDQELVNSILTNAAEDSRLVCRREKKVGSHFSTNICLTVAERRRLQERARDQIRGASRVLLPNEG